MKKDFVVKKSSTGLGLFALRSFKKGELIIEYTGEKITDAEADRRGGRYLFAINDKWTLDASDRVNTARYINHSCSPNSYAELDEYEERIFIRAERAIKKDEEVTFNYGEEYLADFITPVGCKCDLCINGKK